MNKNDTDFINAILKRQREEEDYQKEMIEKLASNYWEVYNAFLKVGFTELQAFEFTRVVMTSAN